MKILLSGATGFVGRHLVKKLQEDGYDLTLLVRSKTTTRQSEVKKIHYYTYDNDAALLCSFMQQEKFDGVIHLASLFLAQHKDEDIKNLIESNVTLGTSLLEAATKSNVAWFINTGTFWQHYQNKKYSPVNLYAATKQAFEDIARYYLETTPINFVTIKLCDTYGKHDTRQKIFNLLTKLRTSQEPLAMSPGEQVLDISHIEDVVSGYLVMVKLLAKKNGRDLRGKSFAIYAKKRYTLRELVKVFEKTTNSKLLINWGGRPYRNREVMVPWNKGEPIPGFKPKHSLEQGIRLTLV